MGLDTSHDCWHGAYSSFMHWRQKLAEVSGYGPLYEYSGFGGLEPWPQNGDILQVLLSHSDCDGELEWQICDKLADRLTELLPALRVAGEFRRGSYEEITEKFIKGLRLAFRQQENVDFH